MAYDESVRCVSVVPGAAIARYLFIVRAADGEFDPVAAAGVMPDGVSMEKATAQQTPPAIPMALPNGALVKITCGGSFSRGDKLESDAAGKAIVFPATVGHNCCGVALEDGALNRIVTMQFFNKGANVGT
jgi:hypothetical protein